MGTTTTTTTTTTTCIAGCGSFTQEGSKCYKVYTDTLIYDEAQAACEGYGGNLASIESQDEQDAIFGLTSATDTWLGGSDVVTHLAYLWEDGATFSYDNWFTNRPKDNVDQDCMKMKTTGTWDNVVCTKELQYACQKDYETCGLTTTTTTSTSTSTTTSTKTTTTSTTTATTTTTTTTTCDVGCGSFTQEGSKCYKVYTDTLIYDEAQAACEGYGGHLASIESQDEQDAIFGLTSATDTWLGASDVVTHLSYLWEDGATFSYDNWFTNRPKDNVDQDCMKMKTTGTWDNVVCTKELQYACQKALTVC